MKKVILAALLTLTCTSAFATFRYGADEIIDLGNEVQVNVPRYIGCAVADGQCFGGPAKLRFNAGFSKRRICQGLGFDSYVRGSASYTKMSGNFYRFFEYKVIYRRGTPGAPAAKTKKGIASLKCLK